VADQRTGGVGHPDAALRVRDPVVVEEHVAVEHAELAREIAGLVGRLAAEVLVRDRHEHELRRRPARGELGDRADGRRSVEPGPDTAVPEDHLAVVADPELVPRSGPLRGRLLRQSERHRVDHRAHARVPPVGDRIDQAQRHDRPEPEVELLLPGDDQVVPGPKRLVEAVVREREAEAALRPVGLLGVLQLLEQVRVVEIEDQALSGAAQLAHRGRPLRLRDDDVDLVEPGS
jgi:hypothetical protein